MSGLEKGRQRPLTALINIQRKTVGLEYAKPSEQGAADSGRTHLKFSAVRGTTLL
jgi:hypothetical protein